MIFEINKINEIYQNRKIEFELKVSKDIKKILLHKYFVLDYEPSQYPYDKVYRIKGLIKHVDIFEDTVSEADTYGITEMKKIVKIAIGYVCSKTGENAILYLEESHIKMLIYGTNKDSTFLEAECVETSYEYAEINGGIETWN